ncbi:MAG: septal ring lytic transglycosylase RlpA family protein [Hyphomicrobiaceae bacterium]
MTTSTNRKATTRRTAKNRSSRREAAKSTRRRTASASSKRGTARTQTGRRVASGKSNRRVSYRTTQRLSVSAFVPERKVRPTGTVLTGLASYYWQPQPVASGGRFNPNALTAAHKTLAFGTRVRVTNLRNNRSVDVVINDRGPYIAGRIIDLSKRAAGVIGMQQAGVVPVRVTVLGR